MNRRILSAIFIITLVSGCKKDLKESEREWNPYVINENLVFESSERQLDTIVIDTIINNAVSSSPAPELYRHTDLIVRRKLRLKENNFASTGVLNISSSTPKKPSQIGFPLYFENANFAGWYSLKDLEKYPIMSVTTKAGTFNDVIKLKSVMYRPKRKNSVQFMYWSKKDGYIKFEKADGFTWELVKKYVP